MLRPIGTQDADALRAHWDQPGVRRYLFDGETVSHELIREIIGDSEADFAGHGYGLWAMLGEDGFVGVCGLRAADDGRIELLYSLDPGLWGRGLATEAARAVLAHAGALGLREVVAEADPDNLASVRLAVRLGMRESAGGKNDAFVRFISPLQGI
ncbi:GNAT family N-acetyltransferase [Streptosporangium sp. KLBMP 9127]|nr:GNAT family N-acetyltransferase [Streptosporangium sp. KLBMP 9127]